MELALITPATARHLDASYLLPVKFCIAPVALHETLYKTFFQDCVKRGYTVILDNGVFESTIITDKDFFQLITEIQPTTVCIPDRIGSPAFDNLFNARQWKQQWEESKQYASLKTKPKLMFILQCEVDATVDFEDVIRDAVSSGDFDVIGLSREAAYFAYGKWTHSSEQEINRLYAVQRLQQIGIVQESIKLGVGWHFLGIGEHVDLIQYYWFVDSMDTASFFFNNTHDEAIGSIKRPSDYFTRTFTHVDMEAVKRTCDQAQVYASLATKLRHKILRDRL